MPANLLTRVVSEVASEQALIPVLWLGWLHLRHRDPGLAWWWLSAVFLVAWLADTAALWMDPWTVSKAYPVSQAAIIGLVFLSRREGLLLIATLALVGIIDVLLVGVGDFDILLRVIAWGAVVGIVAPLKQLGRLRTALLVYFGLGLLAWMWYAIDPAWLSWSVYQLIRLTGIVLFCRAASKPGPQLRVSA